MESAYESKHLDIACVYKFAILDRLTQNIYFLFTFH